MASVKVPEICPCLAEPTPSGSKVKMLLVKTEPLSEGGHSSVKTSLRKNKSQGHKYCSQRRAE